MADKIHVATFTVKELAVKDFACSDPDQLNDDNVAVLLAKLMEDGYWLTHVMNTTDSHAYKYIMVKRCDDDDDCDDDFDDDFDGNY